MKKIIKIEDRYYISADSTYADNRVMVLNQADTFGVFDRWGDIQHFGKEVQGLYHEGTRYLSFLEIRINGERPLLLASAITEDNDLLMVDLTNHDIMEGDRVKWAKGNLHIHRIKMVRSGQYQEVLQIRNFSQQAMEFELSIEMDGDFKDIFELRGMSRQRRGDLLGTQLLEDYIVQQTYKGLDGVYRSALHQFTPAPDSIEAKRSVYKLRMAPGQEIELKHNIVLKNGRENAIKYRKEDFDKPLETDLASMSYLLPEFNSSNEHFNHWVNRSRADLQSLVADTAFGKYPYAGVPWFNTAFGRDGIITALMCLWMEPEITKGVLKFLAQTQAQHEDAFQDAEPGKIFHETRCGEMASLGEVPFGLYYGTIDATPLFIMLAGAYYRRTADLDTIREIWPNIKDALTWIDEWGDMDGDDFVEYIQKTPNGLINQGWKDANDSVHHDSGELADPPIALCEVQAYVYDARKQAAMLAPLMDEPELAAKLESQAEHLKEKFNKAFWDEELGTFVLALDKKKRPCRVKSSNPGHCLWAGIADEKYAGRVADTLMSPVSYNGWGIRTLATDAPMYNPMSYHNGTVWPHDTALCAYGMGRYGYNDKMLTIFNSLLDASVHLDQQRLPELFCGFERRSGVGPTDYPVACSPQAWSVSSVFLLLQGLMGLEIDAPRKRLCFHKPKLPHSMEELHITRIPVDGKHISIHLTRTGDETNVEVNGTDWEVKILDYPVLHEKVL